MRLISSLLLFSVCAISSHASANEYFQVTELLQNQIKSCPVAVGSTYSVSGLWSCASANKSNVCTSSGSCTSWGYWTLENNGYTLTSRGGVNRGIARTLTVEGCPEGEAINDKGKCEEKICEPPWELDPEGGECVLLSFCDRSSTWDAIFEEEQACAAKQGVFKYRCDDFLETLDMSCTEPNMCAPGLPNYPDCLGDLDPTDPIDPPDGGFEPPPIDGDNPLPPADINPPDEIPPQDGTDGAVLQAIQNQHRDMNQALNHISSDLNQGFSDVNNNLRSINNTNNAIGQTIVDQMNQDYEIYQAQRDLTLQNTAATYNMSSNITGSIEGQTGELLDGLSGHGASIVGAIDGLGESLEGVGGCTPNEDNNFTCEGRTGMNGELVWDITTDVNTQVDREYSSAFGSVVSGAQSYIDGGQTDEMKGVVNSAVGVLFGGLPNIGSCTPFSFPMPNGNDISFGCEFSDKFKLIASWLIYIYTVWTLIDLMLNGINPSQRKES